MLLRRLLRLPRIQTLLVVLGLVLLAAGLFKGYELLRQPILGLDGGARWWSTVFLVQWEVLFGCWLMAGIAPRLSRLLALLCFSVYLQVGVHEAARGDSSCDCFGTLVLNPWYLAAIDLAAIAGILLAWDRGVDQNQRWLSRRFRVGLFGILLVAGLVGFPLALSFQNTTGVDVRHDPHLNSWVNLGGKEQRLEQFLQLLSERSGVGLSLDESVPGDETVPSFSIQGVSVGGVMDLLAAKLPTPVQWEKAETGYRLTARRPNYLILAIGFVELLVAALAWQVFRAVSHLWKGQVKEQEMVTP